MNACVKCVCFLSGPGASEVIKTAVVGRSALWSPRDGPAVTAAFRDSTTRNSNPGGGNFNLALAFMCLDSDESGAGNSIR